MHMLWPFTGVSQEVGKAGKVRWSPSICRRLIRPWRVLSVWALRSGVDNLARIDLIWLDVAMETVRPYIVVWKGQIEACCPQDTDIAEDSSPKATMVY